MSKEIIAIGHKNPDTDSVISAVLCEKYGKEIFSADIKAKRAGEMNNETRFILERFDINEPGVIEKIGEEDVVVLDTTEPKQILGGLNENNIYAIIDHHNLGGLKSSKPIYARIEPLGCTATVIYKILKERNAKIDKLNAALFISCIISDTVNFASPTTTGEDKDALKELNAIAGLDIDKFASELFKAKSSLEGIKIEDVVNKDYKDFEMGENKVGIGVWETTDPESVNSKKNKIMESLEKIKIENHLDYVYFAVVDIVRNNSFLYLPSSAEKKIAEDVFGGKIVDGNIMILEGVVSRKKQIVPPLFEAVTKIKK